MAISQASAMLSTLDLPPPQMPLRPITMFSRTCAARITRASVENLALTVGKSVHAFVKAPSVDIVTDGLRPATADNLWWGEVGAIHHGAVSAEVTLVLPGGRSVTALVSDARVAALGLAVGGRAGAVCSANAVILAVFD